MIRYIVVLDTPHDSSIVGKYQSEQAAVDAACTAIQSEDREPGSSVYITRQLMVMSRPVPTLTPEEARIQRNLRASQRRRDQRDLQRQEDQLRAEMRGIHRPAKLQPEGTRIKR